MKTYAYRFTENEVDHLIVCLSHRDDGADGGWYYGIKRVFEARHERLKRKLVEPFASIAAHAGEKP